MFRRFIIRLGLSLLVKEYKQHQFKNFSYVNLEEYGIVDILQSRLDEPMFILIGLDKWEVSDNE